MSRHHPSDITIVSVAYRSGDVLPGMLDSIPAGPRVIVVDNSGEGDAPPPAPRAGVELITRRSNSGFGPACNEGARRATTEYLLFLNPDARLESSCLEALLDAAEQFPTSPAFNPRLADADGGANFKRGSVLLPRRQWLPRGWPAGDTEVPVLSGAAMFCRRRCFEAVGGFDEAIFLYHEDDDLSLRLQAAFGPLRYVHAARVTHHKGRSSPRSPEIARIKSYHMALSAAYALRKHGRPLARGRVLGTGLGKLLSPLVLFSPRKRAQALAFTAGAWRAWRGGGPATGTPTP